MTKEELLIKRYKVTALWPGTHWKVGDVFEYDNYNCFKSESQPSIPLHGSVFEAHPHLFKSLHWAEDRKVEDMPQYVRSIKQEYDYGIRVGGVIKVKEWVLLCETMYVIQSPKREYHPSCFVPATKEEYEAYMKEREAVEKKSDPVDLAAWPKNQNGILICNKEMPMPLHLAKGNGGWEHDDVHETDADSDSYIEYRCNSCGHVWRTEMPD